MERARLVSVSSREGICPTIRPISFPLTSSHEMPTAEVSSSSEGTGSCLSASERGRVQVFVPSAWNNGDAEKEVLSSDPSPPRS